MELEGTGFTSHVGQQRAGGRVIVFRSAPALHAGGTDGVQFFLLMLLRFLSVRGARLDSHLCV